jgi:PST family polysaccharide transporter
LIGKFLGASALGYYSLAYRIMLYPLQNLTAIISRVMFPVFSKISEDDDYFKKMYLRMSSFIAICTFPLMMGIMVLSDKLIVSIFGAQWAETSNILFFLAPIGLLQSVDATTGIIFQSKGKTSWMFIWGIISGAIFVSAFSIGLKWGTVGVAASYFIAYLLILYPGLYFPFKLIGLKVWHFVRELSGIFIVSLFMMTVIVCVRLFLGAINQNQNLALLVLLGILVYLLLIYRSKKQFVGELLNMAINNFPNNQQSK